MGFHRKLHDPFPPCECCGKHREFAKYRPIRGPYVLPPGVRYSWCGVCRQASDLKHDQWPLVEYEDKASRKAELSPEQLKTRDTVRTERKAYEIRMKKRSDSERVAFRRNYTGAAGAIPPGPWGLQNKSAGRQGGKHAILSDSPTN